MKTTKKFEPSGECVIYTRFSPRPGADDCDSCENQQAMCEEFATKKGMKVREIFNDPDRSGSDGAREKLISAVDAIKKGDTLLVWKWDRIARDILIALKVEEMVTKKGGMVVAIQGDIAGNDPYATAMRHIIMVVSELERHQISERTRIMMRQKMKTGRKVSSNVPYGYKEDPNKKGWVIKDDTEQANIKKIVSLRESGLSYWAIAHKLRLGRVKSRSVNGWHTYQIQRIYERAKAEESESSGQA